MSSPLVDMLIHSLDESPQDWSCGDGGYTFDHKSGVEIWVTGLASCEPYNPEKVPLGVVDRWRLWRAVQLCKREKVRMAMDAKEESEHER